MSSSILRNNLARVFGIEKLLQLTGVTLEQREVALGMPEVHIKVEAFGLDSTSIKVHLDGIGALKNGPRTTRR